MIEIIQSYFAQAKPLSLFLTLFYEILTKNEKASPTLNLALITVLIKSCLIKIYNTVNDC